MVDTTQSHTILSIVIPSVSFDEVRVFFMMYAPVVQFEIHLGSNCAPELRFRGGILGGGEDEGPSNMGGCACPRTLLLE